MDVKRALHWKRRKAEDEAPAPRAKPPTWTPLGDTYENHEPKLTGLEDRFEKLADKIAPIRTHERVIHDFGANLFGVDVGITFSQLELVKKGTKGVEVVHVVDPNGGSNWETIAGRKFITKNVRIELQTLALNVPADDLPSVRFLGVGLTSDRTSAMDHDAVSYTAEVKIQSTGLAHLLASVGAGNAAAAAERIAGAAAGSGVADVVGDVVLGAVPVLSAILAVNSARRAVHVLRDDTASKEMKVFAVAHAIADAVRVPLPLIGTLMNVALVGAAAFAGWTHHRYAKHAPPTGPPKDDAAPQPPPVAPPNDSP